MASVVISVGKIVSPSELVIKLSLMVPVAVPVVEIVSPPNGIVVASLLAAAVVSVGKIVSPSELVVKPALLVSELLVVGLPIIMEGMGVELAPSPFCMASSSRSTLTFSPLQECRIIKSYESFGGTGLVDIIRLPEPSVIGAARAISPSTKSSKTQGVDSARFLRPSVIDVIFTEVIRCTDTPKAEARSGPILALKEANAVFELGRTGKG